MKNFGGPTPSRSRQTQRTKPNEPQRRSRPRPSSTTSLEGPKLGRRLKISSEQRRGFGHQPMARPPTNSGSNCLSSRIRSKPSRRRPPALGAECEASPPDIKFIDPPPVELVPVAEVQAEADRLRRDIEAAESAQNDPNFSGSLEFYRGLQKMGDRVSFIRTPRARPGS